MTVSTADQLLPPDFDEAVLAVLRTHSTGIDEYRLIGLLAERFPESLFATPGALRDPLRLFQVHFLLFHALYRLSDRLAECGQQLRIHALGIVLEARRESGPGLCEPDPLRSYYLDWQQWATTHREDVERLLSQFRGMPAAISDQTRGQALALFELPDPTCPRAIKRRYRELVSRHHPDRGGDTATLQEINEALLILQRYYGKA